LLITAPYPALPGAAAILAAHLADDPAAPLATPAFQPASQPLPTDTERHHARI
jgi:hypothetical protein